MVNMIEQLAVYLFIYFSETGGDQTRVKESELTFLDSKITLIIFFSASGSPN